MKALVFISIFLFFISCCKEKECEQNYLSIGVIGFPMQESDTLIIKRFNPPSTLPSEILLFARDRNASYKSAGADSTLIVLSQPADFLKAGSRYEISIPATGHYANITDFTEAQGTWKDCRGSSNTPCRTLMTYKLDGITTSAETVWIKR